jgi:hypothetical protein
VPGAGRAIFIWRATVGVTPTVAAVGRTGACATGRAAANCCGVAVRATRATGCELVIADAGTTVAARAFAKLLIVVRLLVMFVMLLTLVTWVTLTLRM